ncbi:AAA family ATPase [Angustibacter luteus]|uniref:AAA family ATPase n=1 Tax=Angustibacter luteus TaxID=658456 RepID=A0ABW1J8F6_9ACTN
MIVVVLGCAEQALSYELRSRLAEIGDVEVAYVAESSQELTNAVLRFEPDVVFLHDELGPQPYADVVRDLSIRRPGTASVVVSSDTGSESYAAAMEAGARGIVTYPLSFEEVQTRLQSANDWARTMKRIVSGDSGQDGLGGANVIALSGAKGGVGTTTLAVHFGLDVVAQVEGYRVVLVDLDLEKGDVTSLIDVRWRSSIADLAKVADDLSARTVVDAVVPHESGLHLLPAPTDVRDVEYVTPSAVRRIITLLRQHYDLVLLDVGSHVTPVQAAAVELADEVLVVTTPDVLALRALRRQTTAWEQLGVRKHDMVRVLVNQASRDDEVQADTLRKLAQSPVVSAAMPALYRKLEPAVNARDASALKEPVWFQALRAIGAEVGMVRVTANEGAAAAALEESATRRGRRREASRLSRRRQPSPDAGQVTLETVALLPLVLLILAICWQIGVTAMSSVWLNSAATAASHAVSVGSSAAEVNDAAKDRVPDGFRDRVAVTPAVGGDPSRVRVTVNVPLVTFALGSPWDLSVTRKVVTEP